MNRRSRRAFLAKALAAGAALPFTAGPWVRAARALSLTGKHRHLHARAYYSMHTLVEVVAVGPESFKLPAACEAAFAACRRVDTAMNFHDPSSDLSRLNRAGTRGDWMEVPPALFQVLADARRVYEASEGAFDPTVGASVLLFRKAREEGRWPDAAATESAAKGIGYSSVDLDASRRAVRFGRTGTLLDLSGIAKGFAVDQAARAMREAGAQGGIVNAGGDLFAFGPHAEELPPIAIEDPFEPGKMRESLAILEEGLATSGDSEQGAIVQGRPCSHLIEPSRGAPVQAAVASASVRAPTAAQADAWASALYVRPELARRAGVESLLLVDAKHEEASKAFFGTPADMGPLNLTPRPPLRKYGEGVPKGRG